MQRSSVTVLVVRLQLHSTTMTSRSVSGVIMLDAQAYNHPQPAGGLLVRDEDWGVGNQSTARHDVSSKVVVATLRDRSTASRPAIVGELRFGGRAGERGEFDSGARPERSRTHGGHG
jgi:hypothetical protein